MAKKYISVPTNYVSVHVDSTEIHFPILKDDHKNTYLYNKNIMYVISNVYFTKKSAKLRKVFRKFSVTIILQLSLIVDIYINTYILYVVLQIFTLYWEKR